MREWIRTLLRWLDARFLGDGKTFPVYRSTDGAVRKFKRPGKGTMELIVADFLETAPAEEVMEEERFRIALLRGKADDACDGCGRPTFWLDLQFCNPSTDEWQPLLMMPEAKLSVVKSVVDRVAAFLDARTVAFSNSGHGAVE